MIGSDFTIFGLTHDPSLVRQRLPERLGLTPTVIELGSAGYLFFHTSYGDVAETETTILLKLGLAHDRQGNPLSAQSLLARGWLTPDGVAADQLRGNALLVCLSKTGPEFSVYKTLLSLPQLYFAALPEGGILGSDGVKPHLALLDRVEVDETAMIHHYLFRYVLGRHSYFAGISRLMPGELFRWRAGQADIELQRTLRPEAGELSFDRIDATSIAALYDRLKWMMGAYLNDIRATGYDFGTALSGGVDSTIMQLLANENLADNEPRKSFSYVMQTPEFEFEIGYAKDASDLLHTQHTFVPTTPEQYPALLMETIETLGFPIPAESYPCKMSIAKFVADHEPNTRFFFLGNGADSLYGTTVSRKIALLEQARRLPASRLALKSMAALLQPVAAKKAHGLRQTATMLAEINDPYSYKIPTNTVALYSDIETARRSFGDEALKKALGYRHFIEEMYLGSADHTERVHMIELLTDAYECGVVTNHLYLAHRREQIYPFLDESTVRIGLAFKPEVRFLKGWQVKPLLKGILEAKSLTHIAQKRKGGSVFNKDLHDWLRQGALRELVLAIERPAFLTKADFDQLLTVPAWSDLDEPNWFLWNLLTFDIFKQRVIKAGKVIGLAQS